MSFELRRVRWLAATAGVLIGYLAVVTLVPVPFVELSPGPTFNTIGEVDGKPVIEVSGRQTYPTAGHLDLTTVSERGGPFGPVYTSRALVGWFDPDVRVLPQSALFPDDASEDQVDAQNQADFTGSQSDAIAAAMHYLHIPVTERAEVAAVAPGAPADGVLEPGDVIVSVDGTKTSTPTQVGEAMAATAPGDVVELEVLREGKPMSLTVVAGAAPTGPHHGYLGVTTTIGYVPPFDIDFALQDVGGPSAGLMFSLGIIDTLTPSQLNGGRFVAGTGTIDPSGTVGPIGGIGQKIAAAATAGATLFLAPADNCAEATARVPEGLTIARVSTLDDAAAALGDYVAGRPVPSC
ncbi:MAG TPA: PDZ domain-containing protein [Candidatus Nanopelagicales bacterium]|nr:PDZ domain-containing protein [Candidatus Nanopelagicales bacterium]